MIEAIKMKESVEFNPISINQIISHQIAIYLSYFSGDITKLPARREKEIQQVRDLLKRLKSGKDQIKTYDDFYKAYDAIIANLELRFFFLEYVTPSRFKTCLLHAREVITLQLDIALNKIYPEFFEENTVKIFSFEKIHNALKSKCAELVKKVEKQDAILTAIRIAYGDEAINKIQSSVVRRLNLEKAKEQDEIIKGHAEKSSPSCEEDTSDDKTEKKTLSLQP